MTTTLAESVKMRPPVPAPRPRPSRDDLRLAARLNRRDLAALQEVYDRHGGTVFGFLVHALGDRGAAEDVQQQVFIELWQRAPSYDPGRGSLLTWIMTIARSRAIDELRRRVPEPRDPTRAVALLDAAGGGDALDALIDQWRIAGYLRRLPEDELDVLRRRFYGGASQTEIAAATGIPLGTVKSRMLRGLQRLRDLIEADER